MRAQINIGGVLIDHLSLGEAKAQLAEYAVSGHPHQIVTANVDFIRQAWISPDFQGLINTADMVVADGMPLVWLSKLTNNPLLERITGMQLLDVCCELAVEHKYSLFLLGAEPRLAERAAVLLVLKYPGLRIAGTYSPPVGEFTEDEEAYMVELIKAANPTMMMVALGCPKQDNFIRKTMYRTGVPISIGIGGIFNFITGRRQRAPKWAQEMGLEWFFRLMQEPGRLLKRYFVHDLPVVIKLYRGMLLGYQWPLPIIGVKETAPKGGENPYQTTEPKLPSLENPYRESSTYKETAA